MDYVGRRVAIIINSVLFLVGAIILALAPSFAVLVSLQQSDYYLLLLYLIIIVVIVMLIKCTDETHISF